MANKTLSSLHDPYNSANQSYGKKEDVPGNSASAEGRKVDANGSNNTHESLLDFYFGNPTSTHKSTGAPPTSRW